MLRHTYYERDEMRLRDRNCINLKEYYDVEYWSQRFNINPELLQLAVKNAGTNDPAEVEQYIQRKYIAK